MLGKKIKRKQNIQYTFYRDIYEQIKLIHVLHTCASKSDLFPIIMITYKKKQLIVDYKIRG